MGCRKITYHEQEGLGENWKIFVDGLEKSASGVKKRKKYYSFGSIMPNENNLGAGTYRYGLNGMEQDSEVKGGGNSYTSYWRQYDPRLGRWLSLDPEEHDVRMIGLSPYSHALNDPIRYNDPEGDIPWDQVMKFTRVSSLQGWRFHPIHKTQKYHGGLDLAAPVGNDVRSLAGGKIAKIGWDANGYGRYVVIKHPKGYYSLYGHLEKNSTDNLKKGQSVNDGQVIGKSGNTGGSTGPHLHLEVIKANTLSGVFKKENKLDPQAIGDLNSITNGYINGINSPEEFMSTGKFFSTTTEPIEMPRTLAMNGQPVLYPEELSRMTTPMTMVNPISAVSAIKSLSSGIGNVVSGASASKIKAIKNFSKSVPKFW